jgi:cytochrome c-type biogenesis protein CcmE
MIRTKFAVGAALIVGTLGYLAWSGVSESKTYYHTISELEGLRGPVLRQRMRISGNVRTGTIQRLTGRVDFVLEEQGRALDVSYVGRDPLPDTFADGAQALVEGHRMPDGHFVAEQVQAKCASKYEAPPGAKPGNAGNGQSGTAGSAGVSPASSAPVPGKT